MTRRFRLRYFSTADAGNSMPSVPLGGGRLSLLAPPTNDVRRGGAAAETMPAHFKAYVESHAHYVRARAEGWAGPRLLALGDGWLSDPFGGPDLLGALTPLAPLCALPLSSADLDVLDGQLEDFSAFLLDYRFDGVLISLAPDDLIGDAVPRALSRPIKASASAQDWLGADFSAWLAERQRGINAMVDHITAAAPKAKLIMHTIDVPPVSDGASDLAVAFARHGIAPDIHASLARLFRDRVADMLTSVAYRSHGRLQLVDVRGLVKSWTADGRPDRAGFDAISGAILTALERSLGADLRGRQAKPVAATAGQAIAGITVSWSDAGAPAHARERSARFPAGRVIQVGREDHSDISLADPEVSRRHGEILVGSKGVAYEDLNSSNGSRLNGVKVQRTAWAPGEVIAIGAGTKLQYAIDAAPPMADVLHPIAPADAGQPAALPPTVASKPRPRLRLQLLKGNIVHVAADLHVLPAFEGISPLQTSTAVRAVDQSLGGALADEYQAATIDGRAGGLSHIELPTSHPAIAKVMFAGLGDWLDYKPHVLEAVGSAVIGAMLAGGHRKVAVVPMGLRSADEIAPYLKAFVVGLTGGLAAHIASGAVAGGDFAVTICEIDPERHKALQAGADQIMAEAQNARDAAIALEVSAETATPSQAEAPLGYRPPPPAASLRVQRSADGGFSFDIFGWGPAGTQAAAAMLHTQPATTLSAILDGFDQALDKAQDLTMDLLQAALQGIVPVSLWEQLKSQRDASWPELIIRHDAASAVIPWESLTLDGRFAALEAGISRTYLIHAGQPQVFKRRARHGDQPLRMLVVEDPRGDLPGASAECDALCELFADANGAVQSFSGRNATCDAILSALRSEPFDILHYAGHANFDPNRPDESGLSLADGVLKSSDLAALGRHSAETMPSIVFFNGCESGRMLGSDQAMGPMGRRQAQARAHLSLAEQVMAAGVANFIGTTWPVADGAAKVFSTTLYARLLAGDPMGAAVRQARRELKDREMLDWANYLHFGDPGYVVRAPVR